MSWTKISSDHYWRDNQSGTSSVSSCSSSDESESVISVTSGNDGDVSGREQEEDMDENGPSNNDGSGDDVEDELDEEELKKQSSLIGSWAKKKRVSVNPVPTLLKLILRHTSIASQIMSSNSD
jgi:hypothetical protein